MSILDPSPVVHPEDREEPDESGPWVRLLVGAAAAWVPLAALDWRVLAAGTAVWATVRSVYTLLLAPLAAAALVQDTRALGVDGVEVGRVRWGYALVALAFPPVAAVYLVHRRVLVGRAAPDGGPRGPADRVDAATAPDADDHGDPDAGEGPDGRDA